VQNDDFWPLSKNKYRQVAGSRHLSVNKKDTEEEEQEQEQEQEEQE